MTAATVVAVAAVMAEYADHDSGRNVAVTRATIAGRVGCDPRTVTAVWRLLRGSGWAVEAQRGHGSPGTPAAARRPSVYHLTPRPEQPARVHVFHLPPSGGVCSSSPVGTNSPSAHARREPRTPATQTRSPRGAARAPRPLATQRLAGQLVARCHGLGRGHVGAICDALTGAGIDPAVWSAADITGALEADMRARGWCWPDRIERPGGFLASRLRRLEWRPEGPPKRGGVAAAGLDETPRPRVLTGEQRQRIATAKAEIRSVLAGRSGSRFGPARLGTGRGESQRAQLGGGEPAAGSDVTVGGSVGAGFGLGGGGVFGGAVVVGAQPLNGRGGLGAQLGEQLLNAGVGGVAHAGRA